MHCAYGGRLTQRLNNQENGTRAFLRSHRAFVSVWHEPLKRKSERRSSRLDL